MRNFINISLKASVLALCAGAPCAAMADELSAALNLKMKYLSQNQAVISKNIANADTPKYKALELKKPRYTHSENGVTLATTSPMHISSGGGSGGRFKTIKQKDAYETAPNGNNVSIEEQMVKMSENNLEHQTATNLLRKVNGLMSLATGEK